MNPRATGVKPLDNYRIELLFANQERRVFDVKPYLTIGIFQELQDAALFNGIRAFNGSVVWPNELDLDPDTLYLDSQPISWTLHLTRVTDSKSKKLRIDFGRSIITLQQILNRNAESLF